MDIEYKRIDGTSRRYIALLTGLAILALGGIIATYLMFQKGVYLTGMTNRVPWGLQIVLAVFYIGLSEGSLLVSGLYGIFGKYEYKPLTRVTAFLGMLFLVAGLISILTDQGRIDRLLTMPFSHFNKLSMFSLNPILYVTTILGCLVYIWALFKEKGLLTKAASVVVVLLALCVHTGTGFIFAFVARELYHSPLLPVTFVAAANSSGVALMIIVIVSAFRLTGRHLDKALIIWLGRLLGVFVVVAMYVLLLENFHRLYIIESREAARFFMFSGFHSAAFWICLMLIGSLIPAMILFRRGTSTSLRWVVFASALVVFGVFFERYLIVIPGLMYPPDLFPGMEIISSPLEEGIATYKIGFLEVLQAFGVAGLIGFVFFVGLVRLRMLPAEARVPWESPMLKYQMPHFEWGQEGEMQEVEEPRSTVY